MTLRRPGIISSSHFVLRQVIWARALTVTLRTWKASTHCYLESRSTVVLLEDSLRVSHNLGNHGCLFFSPMYASIDGISSDAKGESYREVHQLLRSVCKGDRCWCCQRPIWLPSVNRMVHRILASYSSPSSRQHQSSHSVLFSPQSVCSRWTFVKAEGRHITRYKHLVYSSRSWT